MSSWSRASWTQVPRPQRLPGRPRATAYWSGYASKCANEQRASLASHSAHQDGASPSPMPYTLATTRHTKPYLVSMPLSSANRNPARQCQSSAVPNGQLQSACGLSECIDHPNSRPQLQPLRSIKRARRARAHALVLGPCASRSPLAVRRLPFAACRSPLAAHWTSHTWSTRREAVVPSYNCFIFGATTMRAGKHIRYAFSFRKSMRV